MLKPDEVAKLLETLHAHGYRLRKIGADSLEVDDIGPKLQLSEAAPAQRERERVADESAIWDHVGGRPPWLRGQERKSSESPYHDNEGPDA